MLNHIAAWSIVIIFIAYILFSISYVAERPASQGWDTHEELTPGGW